MVVGERCKQSQRLQRDLACPLLASDAKLPRRAARPYPPHGQAPDLACDVAAGFLSKVVFGVAFVARKEKGASNKRQRQLKQSSVGNAAGAVSAMSTPAGKPVNPI